MKSAQQERIINLWKEGAFVDKNGQPDHQTFLRLLGLGDADAIFEETQLDENKAKSENKIIEDANTPENEKILMQYAAQLQQYQNGYATISAANANGSARGARCKPNAANAAAAASESCPVATCQRFPGS
jgi:hypothetical protein